jgi:Flp pilus assembly protein TadG
MTRRRDERAAATIFVIGMAVVLLVAAGLVIDGGLAINARMKVADDAEQAARAGADAIDLEALRNTGEVTVEPSLAQSAATDYLADLGYGAGQYDVSVAGDSVDVAVRDRIDTALLELVNISNFDVQANASASPLTGPN